jgi:hypothetical protein
VTKVLVGKIEGKRPLGRRRRRWEDRIREEIGSGGGGEIDSIRPGQGPVAGCCEHGDEPSSYGSTELVGLCYIDKHGPIFLLGTGTILPVYNDDDYE